ncbi:M23 family metallopeptidase [Panacagrimonas sp.]|uniref:M23 family metallopeptidase n=1 Tax=Panacagrimonas sp. TaxID=2480088 RepID=UPI003B52E83A
MLALGCGLGLAAVSGMAQAAPQIQGRWIQGGLIVGQIAPGSRVRFDRRQLAVSSDGRFVIGIAYDAPPAAALEVRDPDGTAQRFEYSVEARQYDVQKIGGLPKAMVEPPAEVLKRIADDQRKVAAAREHDTPRVDFANLQRWPLAARVTGVYGSKRILNGVPRQPHFGIDLAAAEGTPVRAPAAGVVRLAERDLYYTGGTLILDHGHGVTTTYLHLSRLDVNLGDEVDAGTIIGKVGKTGRATGPHLCWRANWFDVRLDPSLLVHSEPARKGEHKK